MRVFHVAKISQIAGAEKHLLFLLPALMVAGMDVHMIVLENPDKPADSFVTALQAENVPVERLAFPITADSGLFTAATPQLIRQLTRMIKAHQPDIVHTHLIHSDLYGTIAARLAGVKTILSSRHNLDPFRKRRKWQIVNRVLWQARSGGIAISDAVRQFTLTYEHANPDAVRTIYYGYPADQAIPSNDQTRISTRRDWGIPLDAPVIGSVSRLVKQKGLQYSLEAFAQVRQLCPACYVIAGEGDQRPALEKQAQALGISDSVRFLGWCENPHQVFNAIDVLLTPSLWEGLGVVFLEAMAHSLPIITTNTGPMPEVVIDGGTGYLVPPADANALVTPIITLINDPALRRQMGSAARERVETQFSVERMVQMTTAFYQDLNS